MSPVLLVIWKENHQSTQICFAASTHLSHSHPHPHLPLTRSHLRQYPPVLTNQNSIFFVFTSTCKGNKNTDKCPVRLWVIVCFAASTHFSHSHTHLPVNRAHLQGYGPIWTDQNFILFVFMTTGRGEKNLAKGLNCCWVTACFAVTTHLSPSHPHLPLNRAHLWQYTPV